MRVERTGPPGAHRVAIRLADPYGAGSWTMADKCHGELHFSWLWMTAMISIGFDSMSVLMR